MIKMIQSFTIFMAKHTFFFVLTGSASFLTAQHQVSGVVTAEADWGTHMGIPEDLWFVSDKGSNHNFWLLNLDEGWNTISGWRLNG